MSVSSSCRFGVIVLTTVALAACSADTGSGGDGSTRHDTGMQSVDTGGDGHIMDFDVTPITVDSGNADVDWYAARHDGQVDPPPMYCLPDGGRVTGDSGSDPYCPPDRNLQGCNCPMPGMTAPCWTGPRCRASAAVVPTARRLRG